MEEIEPAVTLRGAFKGYGGGGFCGSGKGNRLDVLKGLDMTVPTGVIYGLLGASGCGKTTLLSCMAGLRHLEAGQACVLGAAPPRPGPRLGFMPQEIGLMVDFSIRDTLFYFGRIFAMSTEEIEERIIFLCQLLELPPIERRIAKLSGGQQRRASMAAALVHNPELLILDEPTVGLDPVLRQKIWDYLVEMTRRHEKTVIISTHYIEEARQSDLVGLMRGGVLLAEASPGSLMTKYATDSLEHVFLMLSAKQHQEMQESRLSIEPSATAAATNAALVVEPDDNSVVISNPLQPHQGENGDGYSWQQLERSMRNNKPRAPEPPMEVVEHAAEPVNHHANGDQNKARRKSTISNKNFAPAEKGPWAHKYGITEALLKKNFTRYLSNPGMIMFFVVFPIAQILFFFVWIGHDPTGLPFAVVNKEFPGPLENCIPIDGCTEERLSCRFIQTIRTDFLKLIPYDDIEKAQGDLRSGWVKGVIELGSNFSLALAERNATGKDTSDAILEQGEISITMDMTDVPHGITLQQSLLESFINFFTKVLTDCGMTEKFGKIPVHFHEPIYGHKEDTYSDFAACGMILCLIFFLGMMVSAMPMILEQEDGSWDRAIVSGVSPSAVLWSHTFTQAVILFVQHFEILFIALVMFGLRNEGSVILVSALVFSQGFAGICLGQFSSVVTNSIMSNTYFTMGSFNMLIMFCGLMWPLEGLWEPLRPVSSALPLTSATTALRAVLKKSAGIYHPDIAKAFGLTAGWAVSLLLLSAFILRIREMKK